MSSTLVRQLVQKNYRHCFQQLSRTSSTTHLFSSSTNTNTLRLFQQQQQQWRLQSSTVTEQQEQPESSSTTTTSETSEEEKKPFVFPIDEERINRMLLPHEEAKKALEILISTLNSEPYIQKANEIAAMCMCVFFVDHLAPKNSLLIFFSINHNHNHNHNHNNSQ